MKKIRKKKNLVARGIAAICATAAVLTAAVLLMPHPGAPSVLSDPEDSASAQSTAATESPIPSNPYGPDDFSYEGDYLTCTAGPSVLGVDVSSHQGEIDWARVADAGVEFAMVRLGYRGTTSGGLYADEFAEANLRGAADAGLQVGAYFFSQAISPEEAEEEAAFVLDILGDQKLTMPVVFDWEFVNSEARTAKVDSRTLTDSALRFLSIMDEAGYWPMMYFNTYMSRHNLHLAELKQYDFWLALYSDRMTFPHEIQMWQYSCTGRVPGIEGDVDLNVYFPDLIKTRSHS